jgi:general secretion pathway protein A
MRENSRVDATFTASGRSPFLTYEPYYGLREKPFSLSADPRFLYKSRSHMPTFDALRAGIRRREGLIVLTGEPGTGKTTLCRSVLEALDRKTFCTLVPDPFVSREDLLKMLLLDFGVMSVEDLRSGRLHGASRPELSYPLYEFLRSLVPLQAYAVLIIDEAQNLSPQLLDEIRVLADLEAPEKLLQLVLVGQPELRTKLKDHSMRQVDQRVSVRVELAPLDRASVGEYIAHRLNVAGGGTDRVTFSDSAIDAIYNATKGNPRLINLACDKALHHGHLARTFTIGPDIVNRSLAELGLNEPAPPAPKQAPVPVPAPVAAAQREDDEEEEATDDFGLGEKFFDRSKDTPEVPPPVDLSDAQLMFGGRNPAPTARRRTLLILACVLVPALVALILWIWQQQQQTVNAAPVPPPPVAVAYRAPVESAPPPLVSAESQVGADTGAQPFEVGVALFSGYDRASRLAVSLAASGFRATTRMVDSAQGRMYEVRTGPYLSREAAEADAAVIRKIPGYGDARVVPQPTVP